MCEKQPHYHCLTTIGTTIFITIIEYLAKKKKDHPLKQIFLSLVTSDGLIGYYYRPLFSIVKHKSHDLNYKCNPETSVQYISKLANNLCFHKLKIDARRVKG